MTGGSALAQYIKKTAELNVYVNAANVQLADEEDAEAEGIEEVAEDNTNGQANSGR